MNLLKISFFSTIAGIIFLAIFSQSLEPKTISISKIDLKMIDQYVKVNAFVKSVNEIKGLTILTLKDINEDAEIIAIVYNFKGEILIDDEVEIIGKVKEYEGEAEIEIEKLRVLG